MLKLKNYMVASVIAVLTLFSFNLKAETKEQITVIFNGKPGGSFNSRTQLYKDGLVAAGYDVSEERMKAKQAVKLFKETDKPTIMVWSNNMVHRYDLFHNSENFIMVEYQQPLWICTANSSKGKDSMTIAHGKFYNVELIRQIIGDNVTLVPYKNSSAMLKGILGGDVDMMVNNQGKSFKYMASGEGTCEPSTQLPIMQATVMGTNLDIAKIRNVIFDISMSTDFIEYHTTRKLERPSSTWEKELAEVQTLEKAWKVD